MGGRSGGSRTAEIVEITYGSASGRARHTGFTLHRWAIHVKATKCWGDRFGSDRSKSIRESGSIAEDSGWKEAGLISKDRTIGWERWVIASVNEGDKFRSNANPARSTAYSVRSRWCIGGAAWYFQSWSADQVHQSTFPTCRRYGREQLAEISYFKFIAWIIWIMPS